MAGLHVVAFLSLASWVAVTSAASLRKSARGPYIGQKSVTKAQEEKNPLLGPRNQIAIVCNGFPDKRPAHVGVRRGVSMSGFGNGQGDVTDWREKPKRWFGDLGKVHPEADKALKKVPDKLPKIMAQLDPVKAKKQWHARNSREKKRVYTTGGISKPDTGSIWTRRLDYGKCEEYHLELSGRELFFVNPSGNMTCSLPSKYSTDLHFLAVVQQAGSTSQDCYVHALTLEDYGHLPGTNVAELATVDAYTQKTNTTIEPEEAELMEQERKAGLPDLAPISDSAVLRLEDWVEAGHISSEIIGSRTLGLDNTYMVEGKEEHVLLEDLRGRTMMDRKDADFKRGHTYVAIRMGRGGDAEFPDHLVFYEAQESQFEPEYMHDDREGNRPPRRMR
eukprot:gnl/TRDRNA2_/TRDRNA2_182022_c0_seq1.p1 gnl/TRDRNA2_/TRDRNA2_182022_c0~~gnl/TRDRNA2_/TRDRNA2_182022_c0_seq1.p1  ORF type:complete len:390 (-),score=81.38 gnl/TRDRNA2_/TRDRNA2_182022_c0_seq1:67-1236(-)